MFVVIIHHLTCFLMAVRFLLLFLMLLLFRHPNRYACALHISYLCGYGDALLRDPTLHQVVYGLMIKLFKRLVSALKKLGTRVVYADFTRIIVHTDKEDLPSAREYIDFVLGAVCSRELFGFLEISPKTYWEQVLWLGPDNWGAILLVDAPSPSDEMDVQEDDDDQEVDVDGGDAAAAVGVDGNHGNNMEDDAEQEWDEDQGGTTHLPGLAVAHNSPMKHKNTDKNGKKGSVTFAKDVFSPMKKKALGGSSNDSSSSNNNSNSSGKNKHRQDQSKDEYAFLDTLLSKKSTSKRSNKPRDVNDDDAFDEDEEDEEDDEEEQDDVDDVHDGRNVGNDNNDSGGQEEDPTDPLLQAHWTLAQYLPPAAAEYFYFIVGRQDYTPKTLDRTPCVLIFSL